MARSLNVVIVASELPYPPTAGNRIRTLEPGPQAGRQAPDHHSSPTATTSRPKRADSCENMVSRRSSSTGSSR